MEPLCGCAVDVMLRFLLLCYECGLASVTIRQSYAIEQSSLIKFEVGPYEILVNDGGDNPSFLPLTLVGTTRVGDYGAGTFSFSCQKPLR